jgi:hypothetical protein
MNTEPLYDDTTPISCTATGGELSDRLEAIERLRGSLVGVDRVEHGLVLRFPARDDVEAAVRRFAVEEKRCCGFWGFDVEVADGCVRLRWDGPPAVADLMDRLGVWFEGTEPLTEVEGLL